MLFVLVLMATSCGADGSDDSDGGDTTQVTGIRWELRTLMLDSADVGLAGTKPTIEFRVPDEVGGTNGCNSYGGRYTMSRGEIGFGELFQTEIGCPPEIAAVENAFMTAIGRVDRYEATDGALTLLAADGTVRLEFGEPPPVVDSALQGSWVLDTIGTADAVSSIVAGTEPTLEITDSGITGSTGCNSFSGSVQWDPAGRFVVSEMSWTEIGCESGIMRQEEAVLDTLRNAASYVIEGDKLLISAESGDRFLRYTATS
jgi:heat shock protein HslJ